MAKMKLNKKFDWRKTVKKAAFSALVVFLAGLIAYMQNEPALLALVPIVEAGRNFIKHRFVKKKK